MILDVTLLTIPNQRLAVTDAKMIDHLNVWYYFKYIFLTVFGKGFGDRVRK